MLYGVRSLSAPKAQGLVDFYNFTGVDRGEKFVGVLKRRWVFEYLKLESDDLILQASVWVRRP